jgi:BASS family bile acid:Na+ symporter
MADVLTTLIAVFGLVFVVGSMLAMGFSLTPKTIVQPLRNVRLVILALLSNFVIVPAIIIGLSSIVPLNGDIKIGMYILALAAGAPFVPKLTQFAKGNIAFGVGVMTLLMVVTVIVLPTVLPLIVPGVRVDPWAVAQPLIFLMLIPLGIGLLVKSRYEQLAEHAAAILNRVTSVSIIILLFLFFGAFWDQIISTFETGAIWFSIFFVVFALIVGYSLGGRDPGTRRVLGIATAQRNIAAGILTAATNFGDRPLVGVTVILVSLVSLIILMIAAGEWGHKEGTTKGRSEA